MNNLNERLILAAIIGNTNKVTSLLIQGANVNTQNAYGRRAIHFAAINGDVQTIQVLLAHGARVNVKDKEGYTPLKSAKERNYFKVCELLEENGAVENPWCFRCWG